MLSLIELIRNSNLIIIYKNKNSEIVYNVTRKDRNIYSEIINNSLYMDNCYFLYNLN